MDEESAIDAALAWLELGEGDRAVLSAIVSYDDNGYQLRWATLLFVPPSIAEHGWPGNGPQSGPSPEADARVDDAGWLGFRAAISIDDAVRWWASALGGLTESLVNVPEANVRLAPARAPLALYPRSNTSLSRLISSVGRPVDCFWFPQLDTNPEPVETRLLGQLRTATGMFVGRRPDDSGPPASGLVVGRIRRAAWLTTIRGGPGLSTFTVGVECDRQHMSYSEIEVELEERLAGEVSHIHRLSLSQLRLTSVPNDASMVVALPTLGSLVQRRVRLWSRDGDLLDETGYFHLVEQINVNMGVIGSSEVATGTIGIVADPSLAERLTRAQEVGRQYEQLIAAGMSGRVVASNTDASQVLNSYLSDARSELLVLDPYFGRDSSDWTILDAVSVPTRVLTGPTVMGVPPANVAVKRWTRQPTPFHDRFYLWDGGGLSVGTSPNGFGKRMFRMDPIERAEAAAWKAHFEAWWNNALAVP